MPRQRDPKTKLTEVPDLHHAKATPRVRELDIQDLNDLATKFHGHEVDNPKVQALTLEDIQSIEEVFSGAKEEGARRAQREGLPGPTPEEPIDWSISSCCCTPCCCCAAAEVDPFAA